MEYPALVKVMFLNPLKCVQRVQQQIMLFYLVTFTMFT